MSTCAVVVEQALLEALENCDELGFVDALNSDNVGDINKIYPHPVNASALELACERGLLTFVSMLLNHSDINIDLWNPVKKVSAIHAALTNGHARIAKLLLAKGADVNVKNRHGRTPLHLVASMFAIPCYKNADCTDKVTMRDGYLEILHVLLKNNQTDINGTDLSGSSAAYLAAKVQDEEVLKILVENGAVIENVCQSEGKSAADLVKEFNEDLHQELLNIQTDNPKPSCTSLWEALQKNDLLSFKKLVSSSEDLNFFEDHRTCLHYACDMGMMDYVKLLVAGGADVNLPNRSHFWTPLHYATARGFFRIIKLLVEEGAQVNAITNHGMTPLHLLIEHQDRESLSQDTNFQLSVDCLLAVPGINLNLQNQQGNTPLHLAVLQGKEGIAKALLSSGADYIIKNKGGQAAINFISSELIEEFLDEGIQMESKEIENSTEFPIAFDYSFIAPSCPKGSDMFEESEETPVNFCPEVDHVWVIFQNSVHSHLLKHPLIASFLTLKWHRARKFYFLNTFLYTVFVLVFSGVAVSLVQKAAESDKVSKEANPANNSDEFIEYVDEHFKAKIHPGPKVVLVLLTIYFAIREVFQLFVAPVRYIFNLENLMEWVMLILLFLLLQGDVLSPNAWRPCLSVALFFSWVELVLMLGRHNQFSMAVNLFFNVSYEFLKVLSWYVVFILGFALTFYTLFYPESSYITLQGTFMKTLIMMIGEVDYDSIVGLEYNAVAYLVLLVFIFSITIVLMNLLTGLAVNDTQELYNQAERISYKSKLEHISYAEAMLLGDPNKYLADYPPFDWICHCFPCAFFSNFLPIKPLLTFLGKRSLIFLDSLPDKRAVIRDIDKKCAVITSDNSTLNIPLDIVNEAKMMILQRNKREEMRRGRNLNDIRLRVKLIDEKMNKLSSTVEGLCDLIKGQQIEWNNKGSKDIKKKMKKFFS